MVLRQTDINGLLARISHQDAGIWVKLAKQDKWRDRSHERRYREVWAGLRAEQGMQSDEGRSSVEA